MALSSQAFKTGTKLSWQFRQIIKKKIIIKQMFLLSNALNNCWKLSFESVANFGSNLRCQLWVIDQILQRVATAEFIQQPRQVADYSWRVRGVDIAWNAPNLYQRHVPIGIGPVCCADLRRETSQQITLLSPKSINNMMKLPIDQVTTMLWCLCILYHQAVTAGLQSA